MNFPKILILFLFGLLCFSCQYSDTGISITDLHNDSTRTIKLLFGGDILLDRGVGKEIEERGIISLFDSVQLIFSEYDYKLANLECPFTNEPSPIPKRFSFRAPTSYADSLKKAGFTHLFLANNHTNDHHRRGLSSTFNAIEKVAIVGIGYGETHSKSCEPVFIEGDDNRIAIFSVVRVPLENWYRMEDKPSICQSSVKELVKKVKELKVKEPQTVILVSLHWGIEYTFFPTAEQRKEAHLLTLAGVDAIIGHHPHVTQSIEFVNDKPVFYSLGNFVFDQEKEFKDRGVLAGFEIQSGKINNILVYPLQIKNCVPQAFLYSAEKFIFKEKLKSLSKGVIFEEIKQHNSTFSTLLIQRK